MATVRGKQERGYFFEVFSVHKQFTLALQRILLVLVDTLLQVTPMQISGGYKQIPTG